MTRRHLLQLAGFAAVSANAAETRQDRGKRVVDEALQALGGDAYLQMQDRVEFGLFTALVTSLTVTGTHIT